MGQVSADTKRWLPPPCCSMDGVPHVLIHDAGGRAMLSSEVMRVLSAGTSKTRTGSPSISAGSGVPLCSFLYMPAQALEYCAVFKPSKGRTAKGSGGRGVKNSCWLAILWKQYCLTCSTCCSWSEVSENPAAHTAAVVRWSRDRPKCTCDCLWCTAPMRDRPQPATVEY
jgi:hypothetical protein